MRRLSILFLLILINFNCTPGRTPSSALVFQTDFGVKDGAVAAMKGVAFGVSPELHIFDLTHEITPYNIWEGAYRLHQTAKYWPAGTVFVSVVDPGVGTERKSVVLKTQSGHYVVSPDNGTLTLVAEELGIAAVREIDEAVNRRANSELNYTFHGRDVYAFTGARLAAGVITFEQVGSELPPQVVTIPYQKPKFENGVVYGTIPVLDPQYGNIWTNIDRAVFNQLGMKKEEEVLVKITRGDQVVFEGRMPFVNTFGDVPVGKTLLYLNSLNTVSFAINMGSFAEVYKIESGPEWQVKIWK
jgi:S-adenosylmethionine hydrolase